MSNRFKRSRLSDPRRAAVEQERQQARQFPYRRYMNDPDQASSPDQGPQGGGEPLRTNAPEQGSVGRQTAGAHSITVDAGRGSGTDKAIFVRTVESDIPNNAPDATGENLPVTPTSPSPADGILIELSSVDSATRHAALRALASRILYTSFRQISGTAEDSGAFGLISTQEDGRFVVDAFSTEELLLKNNLPGEPFPLVASDLAIARPKGSWLRIDRGEPHAILLGPDECTELARDAAPELADAQQEEKEAGGGPKVPDDAVALQPESTLDSGPTDSSGVVTGGRRRRRRGRRGEGTQSFHSPVSLPPAEPSEGTGGPLQVSVTAETELVTEAFTVEPPSGLRDEPLSPEPFVAPVLSEVLAELDRVLQNYPAVAEAYFIEGSPNTQSALLGLLTDGLPHEERFTLVEDIALLSRRFYKHAGAIEVYDDLNVASSASWDLFKLHVPVYVRETPPAQTGGLRPLGAEEETSLQKYLGGGWSDRMLTKLRRRR